MPSILDVWDNLLLGLRLGPAPRICATTTPKPTKWMKDLLADSSTVTVRMPTYDNLENLAPTFRATVLRRYEGTRKGRQELLGEVVEDVDGALWNSEMIDPYRVDVAPDLERVGVGVDPAGGRRARNDETGIVVAGVADGHLYVLADGSGRYSPTGWAAKVVSLFEAFKADVVVPERNYGGDMVAQVLRNADSVCRSAKSPPGVARSSAPSPSARSTSGAWCTTSASCAIWRRSCAAGPRAMTLPTVWMPSCTY